MDKKEAAQICNLNLELKSDKLDSNNGGNVTWANINSSKNVWWADIAINKFKKNHYIILNNHKKQFFYLILIKSGEIKDPYSVFRKLRDNYISIEIASSGSNKFIDVKSNGTNFNFKNFIIYKYNYARKE